MIASGFASAQSSLNQFEILTEIRKCLLKEQATGDFEHFENQFIPVFWSQ